MLPLRAYAPPLFSAALCCLLKALRKVIFILSAWNLCTPFSLDAGAETLVEPLEALRAVSYPSVVA
jgi:hypothetical protein